MRLTGALVDTQVSSSSTYVDDPLSTYYGTDEETDRAIAKQVGGLLAIVLKPLMGVNLTGVNFPKENFA